MHKPAARTGCTPNASGAVLHGSRVHIPVPIGAGGTSPLLSPSQAARGEGTTSQCR